MMHVRLQNQNELKKQSDELSVSLSMCKSELDSLNKLDVTKTATLEALRLEKDRISTQILLKKQEINKLMTDVNRVCTLVFLFQFFQPTKILILLILQTNTELEKLKKTCNSNKENNESIKDLLPNTGDVSNELEENSIVNNEENTNKKLTNENTTLKAVNKITELPDIVYNLIKNKTQKNDNNIK